MVPVLGGNKACFRRHVMLLVSFRGVMNVPVKRAAPAAVKFKLLNSFGQCAKIPKEPILFGTRKVQPMKRTLDHEPVADSSQNDKHRNRGENLPGEPAQVGGASKQNRYVD